MSNGCVYINEPVDLGCFEMILKDQIQLSIEGWIEPRDNENDPAVPFDFRENEENSYKVEIFISSHKFSDFLVHFSSEDEKGLDGGSSIILNTGTDPDNEPSSIVLDAVSVDIKEFKYLKDFVLSIIMTNPEGAVFTLATAEIKNDWRNYS